MSDAMKDAEAHPAQENFDIGSRKGITLSTKAKSEYGISEGEIRQL